MPFIRYNFNYLVKHAFAVLTDSGGITEETTVMNVPCITLRENTERLETCSLGTNVLVGSDLGLIEKAFDRLWSKNWKQTTIPQFWDGKAAGRIISRIIAIFNITSS